MLAYDGLSLILLTNEVILIQNRHTLLYILFYACLLYSLHDATADHWKINEPQREKTYLLTCAPNKFSNLPVHPRSLISLSFRCLHEEHYVFGYPKRAK